MTAQIINTGDKIEMVATSDLSCHPDNPRRGDVDSIRESISANGFYGALVVQRSTGHILAGNHRFMAAQAEGLEKFPVIYVDVDDEEAKYILVVDNRSSDKAENDQEILAAILQGLNSNEQGLSGTGYSDADLGKVLNDDRADWREAWALFPGDVAYVWHGALHAATVAESLGESGFNVRSQIIWAKERLVLSRGDYHWQHEPCWYAVKKTGKGHWAGDRKQTTLWQISSRDQDAKTVHGTQKPVECMRRPILNNSSPGQAVYEPFMGSGTTLIAAESTGRSAVAAAAYRTVTNLIDDRTGQTYDYTRKQGVEFSEILIPKTAPRNLSERNALWDSAEAAEKRKNSVTACEYEIALPAEFNDEQKQACVHEFSHWLVDRFAVGVDVAIQAPHREGDQRNYHAHILTTTRAIDSTGLAKKTRDLDDKKSGAVIEVREKWAEIANRHLERAQITDRIDHRSHKDCGIEAAPTFHLGVMAAAMERRGLETDRGNQLRFIMAANKALQIARLAHMALLHQMKQVARKSVEVLSAAGSILLNRKTRQAEKKPTKSRMNQTFER